MKNQNEGPSLEENKTTQDIHPDSNKGKPEEPGQSFVLISIDGIDKKIHRGNQPVSEIRALGNIPDEFEINQLIGDQYVPLKDDGHVVIKGGEKFIRMPRSGGFS